jgi:hypothetical protein
MRALLPALARLVLAQETYPDPILRFEDTDTAVDQLSGKLTIADWQSPGTTYFKVGWYGRSVEEWIPDDPSCRPCGLEYTQGVATGPSNGEFLIGKDVSKTRPSGATHLMVETSLSKRRGYVPLDDQPRPKYIPYGVEFVDEDPVAARLGGTVRVYGSESISYEAFSVHWGACSTIDDEVFCDIIDPGGVVTGEIARCYTGGEKECTVRIEDVEWPTDIGATHLVAKMVENGYYGLRAVNCEISDAAVAQGVDFLDTNFERGFIAGTVVVEPAMDERSVVNYRLFVGNATHPVTQIAALPPRGGGIEVTHLLGVHELEACCRYFHVVTENANGLTNAAITMKILDDASERGAPGEGGDQTCFNWTAIDNASPDPSDWLPVSYLTTVKYWCDDGYKVTGLRKWFQLICMHTGELECAPGFVCACKKETCYDLKQPKNSTRVPGLIEGRLGHFGDVVEYRCNGKLVSQGPDRAPVDTLAYRCNADRTWDCTYDCACAPQPEYAVFEDTDERGGWLSGIVTVHRAVNEWSFNVKEYHVHWGKDWEPLRQPGLNDWWRPVAKLNVLCDTIIYDINGDPNGRPGQEDCGPVLQARINSVERPNAANTLLVYATPKGSTYAPAQITIVDAAEPLNITFLDYDPVVGNLEGKVTVARAASERDIVAYNLYWGKTEDEKLGGKDTVPLRTIPVEDTDPSWPAGTFVHEFRQGDKPPGAALHLLVRSRLSNLQEMPVGPSVPLCDCCTDDIVATQSFKCDVGGRLHAVFALHLELEAGFGSPNGPFVKFMLDPTVVEEVVRYACVQVDMPSSALAVDVMDRGSGRDGKVVVRLRGPRDYKGLFLSVQSASAFRSLLQRQLKDKAGVLADVIYGPISLAPGPPLSMGMVDIIVPDGPQTTPAPLPTGSGGLPLWLGGALLGFAGLVVLTAGAVALKLRLREMDVDARLDEEWDSYAYRAGHEYAKQDAMRNQGVKVEHKTEEIKSFRPNKPADNFARADFNVPTAYVPEAAPSAYLADPEKAQARKRAEERRQPKPQVAKPRDFATPEPPGAVPREERPISPEDKHLKRVRLLKGACEPLPLCIDGAALIIYAADAVTEERLPHVGNIVATQVAKRKTKIIDVAAVREVIAGGFLDAEAPMAKFTTERLFVTQGEDATNAQLLKVALQYPDFKTAFADCEEGMK